MNTPTRTNLAYSWLSAEDVVRHALAAYYALCRREDACAQLFPDDPHDPRYGFAETLGEVFGIRLLAHGRETGAPGFPDGMSEYLAGVLEIPQPPPNEVPIASFSGVSKGVPHIH